MTEPLLYLGDVGLVVEGVGRRGGLEAVGPKALHVDTRCVGINLYELADPGRRDGLTRPAAVPLAYRLEQWGARLVLVPDLGEVFVQQPSGGRVQQCIAELRVLAVHAQMSDSAPPHYVAHFERADLLAPQAVE